MKTKDKLKPWLDDDGKELAEEKLHLVSRSWSPETWEEYLATIEKEQEEISFETPFGSENYSQEKHEKFYKNIFKQKDLPNIEKNICSILRELSNKQQAVIYLLFWEGKSLGEIGKKLRINKTSVMKLKSRALSYMAERIINATFQKAPVCMSNSEEDVFVSLPWGTIEKTPSFIDHSENTKNIENEVVEKNISTGI
ncbi:MAG: hypothetical protein HOO06_09525 [Bdellovibrionaceae bacterium]|jgi:DNA-directed RNA polymerase sigma subunit (sigma70/sigma32)|nr:hypothetical protein [Pseudobdellovibrionaceae bacterium]